MEKMKNKIELTKELLEQKYNIEKKSTAKIMKETGWSQKYILKQMTKFNIPRRKPGTDRFQNRIGERYGKLIVIKAIKRNKLWFWLCKCDCGNEKEFSSGYFKTIDTKNRLSHCGCIPRKIGKEHKSWAGYGEIPLSYWHRIIQRCEKYNINLNITIEYINELLIKQDFKCCLSNMEIYFGNAKDYTASLDRIDSDQDYIIGNVQWVHKDINKIKSNFTEEKLIELCVKIAIAKGGCVAV